MNPIAQSGIALEPIKPAASNGWHGIALCIAALALLPLLLPYTALATNVLVYGLFALGYNLVFGRLGLLSFGHATFFGAGAYAAGIILTHQAPAGAGWLAPALLCAVAISTLLALAMSFVAARLRGIYLAMVTLALGQCAYFAALQAVDWTGGENGLSGVHVEPFALLGLRIDLTTPFTKYYAYFCVVAVVLIVMWRVLESPFGLAVEAVRENEARAKACGYNANAIKMTAFAISGAVCGIAGAFKGLHLGLVPLETLSLHTAGLVVLTSLLGGMRTFFGPFIGALAILVIEDVLAVRTEHWQFFTGAIFVACVLFFPQGITGTLSAKWRGKQ